jgi:hypothetical protein
MVGLDVNLKRMRAILREFLAPSRVLDMGREFGPTGLAFQIQLTRDSFPSPRTLSRREAGVTPPREVAGSLIVTQATYGGADWIHASLAWVDHVPTYEDLATLHRAVFGDRYSIQVFAPPSAHVNRHPYALHLWGRADGVPVHPMAESIERSHSI